MLKIVNDFNRDCSFYIYYYYGVFRTMTVMYNSKLMTNDFKYTSKSSTSYLGLIYRSTAKAIASWGTFEGTLMVLSSYGDRSFSARSSYRVPS